MNKKLLVVAISSSLLTSVAYAETKTNEGNWKSSIIMEGLYVDRNEGELSIHGMPSGGHNHGLQDGLQAGHNEVVITGNITDKFGARITTAITEKAEEEGNGIEVELEEAFIESQGLGQGFDIKAGRFYTDLGYLSSKHNHEWDFADQPLVYEAMFGVHPTGDGVQFAYLAPTDTFLKIGTELFFDEKFPSGKVNNSLSAATVYAKIGGDIGTDHSWLAGIGRWQANNIRRDGEMHSHGHDEHHDEEAGETPQFSGDSSINTISAVYKWAPNGNPKQRNFKLYAEYFQRDEDGVVNMLEPDGAIAETSSYNGDQSGWYAQAVYQFHPHWRVGVRHDRLKINNTGSDEEVLEEAGLHSEGHTPKRDSLMLDYSPREYSRLRLQYNRDERTETPDDQVILQYVHSFGSHGAHAF